MPELCRPRVAFVGLGWIGRHRLQAVAADVEVLALVDEDPDAIRIARAIAPAAAVCRTLDEVLANHHPDGVVIATPSAVHADQSRRALAAGCAVFCQKPLGRTAAETRAVIAAARAADRLLGVDLSYRFTEGLSRVRTLVRNGTIGNVFAVDLTFHNAYGPDKPWFYDVAQSGGGCLLDLGVHLVDALLWTCDAPVIDARGQLFAAGSPLRDRSQVEDFALGNIELAGGLVARLACSWRAPVGRDADIDLTFIGSTGGLTFRNVSGSFYDFTAEHHRGTVTHTLCGPPDEWGGRAIVAWAQQLASNFAFDEGITTTERVAETLDLLYGAAPVPDAALGAD